MTKIERIEKALAGYVKDAINGEIYVKPNSTLTNKAMIGNGLSYYVTEILHNQRDTEIENKWIDGVSWEKFDILRQI